MTRLPTIVAMMLGSLSLATAARAAPDANANDENVADVRCVVVAFALTQSPDPQVKALATGASLYFVGRLRGRSPRLDLEDAIAKQVAAMTPAIIQAELGRCSGVLQEEGGRLQVIGADLAKRSGAAAAKSAAPATPAPK